MASSICGDRLLRYGPKSLEPLSSIMVDEMFGTVQTESTKIIRKQGEKIEKLQKGRRIKIPLKNLLST